MASKLSGGKDSQGGRDGGSFWRHIPNAPQSQALHPLKYRWLWSSPRRATVVTRQGQDPVVPFSKETSSGNPAGPGYHFGTTGLLSTAELRIGLLFCIVDMATSIINKQTDHVGSFSVPVKRQTHQTSKSECLAI